MTQPPNPVVRAHLRVDAPRLARMAAAIGTRSAGDTAALVPFFGPTVDGHQRFLEAMPFDRGRTTLGRQRYRWARPFRGGEAVDVAVVLDAVAQRSTSRLYVVHSTFTDDFGDVVQTQETTFIERGGA